MCSIPHVSASDFEKNGYCLFKTLSTLGRVTALGHIRLQPAGDVHQKPWGLQATPRDLLLCGVGSKISTKCFIIT